MSRDLEVESYLWHVAKLVNFCTGTLCPGLFDRIQTQQRRWPSALPSDMFLVLYIFFLSMTAFTANNYFVFFYHRKFLRIGYARLFHYKNNLIHSFEPQWPEGTSLG